jgi:diguanylate cyclase (GGDEF)-like protein
VLLQSLALSRQIADICVAADDRRAACMPRLFILGARLCIEKEDLKVLCDNVVREWTEWASILNVAAPRVPSFEELAQAQPAQLAEGGGPAAGGPSRLRVLVVDGDRAIRAAVRGALEGNGYEALEAADGQEGLRVALESEPHMMVAGRRMAAMDGVELTRALRGTRLGRAMYILMLAAPEDDDKLVEGYESGVDDHLIAEPLNQRLLLARLGAGQRIVRLHQELEHDREELRRFAADLAVSNRRLEEAALTDVLTGYPNRRYAMDRMQREWAASSRNKRPLACMVIDLDRFKQVNDASGHDAGDAYLRQVARTIRGALRTEDVVCRTGGDEFLVICPDTGLQAALSCAERVRHAVEQNPVSIGSRRLAASMSAGVAVRDVSMPNADALIKRADEGVYLAKQRGRNRVATSQQSAASN